MESTLTSPCVSYKARMKVTNDIISFDNALEAPDYGDVKYFEEPFAEVTLMVPHFALNDILAICAEKRAE